MLLFGGLSALSTTPIRAALRQLHGLRLPHEPRYLHHED